MQEGGEDHKPLFLNYGADNVPVDRSTNMSMRTMKIGLSMFVINNKKWDTNLGWNGK